MRHHPVSRRAFLQDGAATAGTILLGSIVATSNADGRPTASPKGVLHAFSPPDATVIPGFLAAKLRWERAAGEAPHSLTLTVTPQDDHQHPVAHVVLKGDATTYALPLLPTKTYGWQLQPTDAR